MGRPRKTDRRSPTDEQDKLDEVFALIRTFEWSLGYFLLLVFSNFATHPPRKDGTRVARTPSHKGFVNNFLSKQFPEEATSVHNIISLIYDHPDGTPPLSRNASCHPPTAYTPMARPQMLLWAFLVVKDHVLKEAANLVKRNTGLHLPADRLDWETLMQFSLDTLRDCIIATAPLLYSLVVSVATSPNRSTAETGSYGHTHASKAREPQLVSETRNCGILPDIDHERLLLPPFL